MMIWERCQLWHKIIFFVFITSATSDYAKDEHGVYYPTDCEVCKYVSIELMSRLEETGKTHDIIETGYSIDGKKMRKKYVDSELRLIESMEDVCEKILEYNIHKERSDSTRFAKGMSQTFRTLHGLVDKGVKVDLGIPEELWDKPSAEITMMKTKCETLLENHDEDIADWFFNHRQTSLTDFLCSQRALKKGDDGCLIEGTSNEKEEKSETKSSTNAKNEL